MSASVRPRRLTAAITASMAAAASLRASDTVSAWTSTPTFSSARSGSRSMVPSPATQIPVG